MAAYTAIDDPEAYFQTVIYTGNGSNPRTITLPGDTDMQPDMLFQKNRGENNGWTVADAVRGANITLFSDSAAAEVTDKSDGHIDAFTSTGFTVGAGDSADRVNTDTQTYAAWCWKESATSGFDIVSFTGDGNDDRDISHSLSAVPHFIILKNRSATGDWFVYHKTCAADNYLVLNQTYACQGDANTWQSTPTSSVFEIGSYGGFNGDGNGIIAYCFAPKQGFSKFGTYEGNGVADGAFVYTGFKPAFVMTKSVDSTSSWHIFDNKREGYNVDNNPLVAEATTIEATTDMIDILSNGFKLRISTDPNVAETYIYMAVAEAPFVNSNGVPCNAR